jgi:hypothetical protein
MGLFTKLARAIFAATDAVGAPRKISPAEAAVWGTEVEVALNAAVSSGALVYATKADIDADLAHPANTGGWVVADPTADNNGIYNKSGASGPGSWTRRSDLRQGTNSMDGDPAPRMWSARQQRRWQSGPARRRLPSSRVIAAGALAPVCGLLLTPMARTSWRRHHGLLGVVADADDR